MSDSKEATSSTGTLEDGGSHDKAVEDAVPLKSTTEETKKDETTPDKKAKTSETSETSKKSNNERQGEKRKNSNDDVVESNESTDNKKKDEGGKMDKDDQDDVPSAKRIKTQESTTVSNPFVAALEKAKNSSKDSNSTLTTSSSSSIFGTKANSGTAGTSGFFGMGASNFGTSFGTASNSTTSGLFGSKSTTSTSIFGKNTTKIGNGGSTTTTTSAFGSKTPFSSLSTGTTSILWGTSSSSTPSTTSNFPAFGSSVSKSSASLSPNNTSNKTQALLSTATPESVLNGEENEESILQCRTKLFSLVAQKQSTPSGPSKSDEEKKQSDLEKDKSSQHQQQTQNWREVGIGPLRILRTKQQKKTSQIDKSNDNSNHTTDNKSKDTKALCSNATFRIVQRRECTPGGPGTKVILNIVIGGDVPCTISRQADKYVQLMTVCYANSSQNNTNNETNDNELETKETTSGQSNDMNATAALKKGDSIMYLFKVKTVEEADELQKQLEACISESEGAGDSQGETVDNK